jgi:hypothetical protein
MNANHSFSRRFFADFIASRVKAWRLEGLRSESPGRPSANHPYGHPAGGGQQPATEARRDASGPDVHPPRLTGLTDPRRSHGLEIG